MKVDIHHSVDRSRIEFVAMPDDQDVSPSFAGGMAFIEVPSDWNAHETHPDIVALTAITILHPFVGAKLAFNLATSRRFQEACSKFLPYECHFPEASSEIEPRARGPRPGLSFSGGVDSTAALALMPAETVAFFLDRVDSEGREPSGLYVKDSAYVACDMIAQMGYEVRKVRSNLEYIRKPVGFPVDWASGAPAILHADYCGLSSVSWGVVAESGYRVGHDYFIDFPKRTIFSRWNGLLKAVGLCLGAPVAGLSEVCTSLIVRNSHFSSVAQSCIRGDKNQPCMNCFKCMRKSMLDAALDGRRYLASEFEKVVRFRGHEKIVLGLPIKHENVFRWTVERLALEGCAPTWPAFVDRLGIGGHDVSWAEAWYPPSAALIPEEYREAAVSNILQYVAAQTPEQEEAFRSWDLRPDFAADTTAVLTARLERDLAANTVA